jgi:hypothetical protein
MAGLESPDFDEALLARHISSFDEETLAQDLETLRTLGSP